MNKFFALLLAVILSLNPLVMVQAGSNTAGHSTTNAATLGDAIVLKNVSNSDDEPSMVSDSDTSCYIATALGSDCNNGNHCCAAVFSLNTVNHPVSPGFQATPLRRSFGVVAPTEHKPPR